MTTLREKMKQEMILRGFSCGTQEHYMRAVLKLHAYYKRSPAQLTEPEIKDFLLQIIKHEKCAASTYNVLIHGLKFFYEVVLKKPAMAVLIPRMKEPQKLPDVLSALEVECLIESTHNIKYRTIFVLAYGAGLRAAEIAALRVKDINSERSVIHVRLGKGNKDRYVILSPFMLKTLRDYWKACRSGTHDPNALLFLGRSGQEITPSSIGAMYKNIVRKIGIQKQGSIHGLRHAFATHSLEAGADLYSIKQQLGHSSITSTVRYLRMTDKLRFLQSPIERLTLS